MNNESKWYIICTKPKLERRIIEIFEKKQIAVYLPKYNKLQFQNGRKKIVNTLLLPTMFFAFLNDDQLTKVTLTNGVIGLMYKLHKPAVIKSKEILAMQYFLSEHENVLLEKITLSNHSDSYGIQSNKINELLVNEAHRNQEIYLPSLGYKLVAKVKEVLVNEVA